MMNDESFISCTKVSNDVQMIGLPRLLASNVQDILSKYNQILLVYRVNEKKSTKY